MAHAELVQPVPSAAPEQASRWPLAVALLGAIGFALGVGLSLGGEAGRFASTGVAYAPLIVLAALLQFRTWKAARVLSWIWFWLILISFALLAAGLVFASFSPPGTPLTAEAGQRIVGPLLGVLIIVLVGMLLAATPAWLALGRLFGARLDRANPGHAQGTVGVLVLTALSVAPLVFLAGRAPLLDLLNNVDPDVLALGPVQQLLAQIYTVIWTVVLVLVGSAWPTGQSIRGAMARLGLGRLSIRDVLPLAGIVIAAVLVGNGVDAVNRVVLGWLGWPLTDSSIVTRLVPVAATPVGAIVVAACAGISEELLVRGLLQPRFGWLLANIGFAAAHAFQYGVDGLVGVFVVGAILAFVRYRWNTSASIGVHFAYDAVLFLLAAFGV